MIEPLLTTALLIDSQKIIVPMPPRVKPKLVESIQSNLADAAENLATHHSRLNAAETLGHGGLFLVDAESEIEEVTADMEKLAGYVSDLREYARFWRRHALKLVEKYESSRPVIYKPFDEV